MIPSIPARNCKQNWFMSFLNLELKDLMNFDSFPLNCGMISQHRNLGSVSEMMSKLF